jgi:molecular chaperone DnaK
MLTDQICKPDTSIDPESVIVKGAAIYASRINLNDEVKNYNKNSTKIQLEIGHEPSSLESDVFVTLKILEDKTEGEIPEKVFAEIKRSDNAWESGRVEINTIGEVIDVQLKVEKTNIFEVTLYDDKGNRIESEPISFSIIQGSKIGSSTLPYNIGTEIIQETTSKILFKTIPGLEKNQSLPAIGTLKYFNIDKDIRPGIVSDVIKIPLYQGDYGSEGTRAIYHDHIFDITISGTDLPCLLPKNSDIELTIVVDEYQSIATQAYFPSIDYTCEIEVSTCLNNSVESGLLIEEAKKAKEVVYLLKGDKHQSYEEKLIKAESVIDAIEQYFDNNRNNIDEKLKLLTDLRKTLAIIDELIENAYWPKLESDLKKEFIKIEEISSSYKIETISNSLALLKSQLDDVLIIKDLKLGKDLLHGLIDEIRRIDAINERHDREYLQLFENGDLTLFEVKKSLEEANRQNGVVYHEVLELINQEYKNLTKEKVEELLFQLTEDGLIPATIFQECFELLSTTNDDAGSLVRLYINIKSYDSK